MFSKFLILTGITQVLLVDAAYYPPGCGPWPAGVPEVVNGVKRPPYRCGGGPAWPPEQPAPISVTVTVTSTTTVQLAPKTVTETTEAPPKTKTLTEFEELPPKTRTIIETETLPAQTKTVIETETLPAKTKTVTETEQLPAKTKTFTETETETLPAKTLTETETLPAKTVYQVAPTELAHAAANQCASWFSDGSRPVPVFDLDGQPQCCLPHPDSYSKIYGDCHVGPRI
ncbi:hypothetical protein ONS95_012824 [Cadophora gregata]|uniref:uncharacterized protein n=1 Tax=Cadophora gregata TaxID=51156 RepID=UPI0026DAD074|nr:uncharacterized protein ONS95_012824 [Cadophora gregata]KAK0101195.1 hypothetical protein ONS96_006416 [Cadophora gregata f. sp. sojae]KAK0115771.1 hypothetical protein ONS95_012824 [Cadophora gregata]